LHKLISETISLRLRRIEFKYPLEDQTVTDTSLSLFNEYNNEDEKDKTLKQSKNDDNNTNIDENKVPELDYVQILKTSYDLLEDGLLHLAREVGCRDGTTANSVLITKSHIYCANTGDSRAVLSRNGVAIPLSIDHKPFDAEERNRIVKAGGQVKCLMTQKPGIGCLPAKRVPEGIERLWPGGFSVSRALGDIDYKDLRRRKCKVVNVLIHTPDITETLIDQENDEFILIGTDGLFDVINNQTACDFVWKNLRKGADPFTIAKLLTDKAFALGSEDNITALIIYFNKHDLSKQVLNQKK